MITLNKVRTKIIEAVPEIVEPKFGCKVQIHLTEGGGTLGTIVGCDATQTILYVSYAPFHKNQTSVLHELKSHCILIGRPITLADVLRAITKANEGNGWTYACTAEGELILLEWNDHSVKAKWNLTLPLDEQSPETIDFLAKILCHD